MKKKSHSFYLFFVVCSFVVCSFFVPVTSSQTSNCVMEYKVEERDDATFFDPISVFNFTDKKIDGWTVELEFSAPVQIVTAWNISYTVSENVITLSDQGDWTAVILPEQAADFGLQISGIDKEIMQAKLNGMICDLDDSDSSVATAVPSNVSVVELSNGGQNQGNTIPLPFEFEFEPSGNQCVERFSALYEAIHLPENGYFDAEGIPYYAAETLLVDDIDYGHLSTSETVSYWLLLESAYGSLTGDWSRLDDAWSIMEQTMIPTASQQPTVGDYTSSSPATYSLEQDFVTQYPVPFRSDVLTGFDPIVQQLSTKYGSNIYGMHWLLDNDNWYQYGDDSENSIYVNTYQRGINESVWETIPHPSWENFEHGGENGFLDFFVDDTNYSAQWRYTTMPTAEARAIEAVYFAWKSATDQDQHIEALVPKATKMGDWLRYAMFDKYFKEIGCRSIDCAGGTTNDSAHYLLSWYYAWGGALASQKWSFRIGSSHVNGVGQTPLTAWILSDQNDEFTTDMIPEGSQDWTISMQRQIELYRWLQSAEGAIVGGVTNSWNGKYETPPADVSTFYELFYVDDMIPYGPGKNQSFYQQATAIQQLASYYEVSQDQSVLPILEKWIAWAIGEINWDIDGQIEVPTLLGWSGMPSSSWNGEADAMGINEDLHVEILGRGQHIGSVASLARTFAIYGREANDPVVQDEAERLLNAIWDFYWDETGVTRLELREDYAKFDTPLFIPSDLLGGTIPTGERLSAESTFISFRQQYQNDPEITRFAENDLEFQYHRFEEQAQSAIAYAECALDQVPYPALTLIENQTPEPTIESKPIQKTAISVDEVDIEQSDLQTPSSEANESGILQSFGFVIVGVFLGLASLWLLWFILSPIFTKPNRFK